MRFPKAPVRILVVACLLVAALIGLVIREGTARSEGDEVSLSITGYDPRELLTGHYVQFQIQSNRPGSVQCPPGIGEGEARSQRWVALAPAGQHDEAVAETASRPEALKHGPIAVIGRLTCLSESPVIDPKHSSNPEASTIQIDVGVDRLHVDQAQAEAIQKALQTRTVPPEAYVILSIGRDGKARLKGLVAGGKRTDLTWF